MKERLERIRRYKTGQLSAKEHKRFESEMAMDESLAKDVANYDKARNIAQGFIELEVHDVISDLENSKNRMRTRLLLGIVVTLLAVLFYLIVIYDTSAPEIDKEVLFAELIVLPDTRSHRGSGESGRLEEAFFDFDRRDFEGARSTFDQILDGDSENSDYAHYYLGIIDLIDGKYSNAIMHFDRLDSLEGFQYVQYYQSMCFYFLRDISGAQKALDQVFDVNSEKVQRLKDLLSEFEK